MADTPWTQIAAQQTIDRLMPRLKPLLADDAQAALFEDRLRRHFPRAFVHLHALYGGLYDFFWHLEQILTTTARCFAERPAPLHQLDARREDQPDWFLHEGTIGAVAYVDRFADDLAGLHQRIPYLKELGITYLHLMPLFLTPQGNSDGGYAISDFRRLNPALGTMQQLAGLADALRREGISLVLDFVFNHTSDEHPWATAALNGDPTYQGFYHLFPDRTLPDAYEAHLREIFPEQAPGSFTYRPEIDRWVWTTFHDFQWDLNYANPAVFDAMLGEMLFLANQGVAVLRLDAVVFIWKRLGTPCENEPEVHHIIRAFNALVKIAAPAMLFKSEAIVHPDDVADFIDPAEAPLSYNPTFMALIWEALATREVKLLLRAMTQRFDLPPGTAWVNYVRVHDDIGWSFADEDAAAVGINGFDHRQFLNRFYTGAFPGSFAAGVPFNFNPETLDMRISGTCASLAGLETALAQGDAAQLDLAIRRVLMIHALILAAGGVPLLYLGDEIGTLNDYSYRDDPALADDSRWVHRPRFDWTHAALRHDATTVPGRLFTGLRRLIQARQGTPSLGAGRTQFFDPLNPHVLAFIRDRRVLVLANFSEHSQPLRREVLGAYWPLPPAIQDLVTGEPYSLATLFSLEPYQVLWLAPAAALRAR